MESVAHGLVVWFGFFFCCCKKLVLTLGYNNNVQLCWCAHCWGCLCCNTGCRERWASHFQEGVDSPHLLGFCGIPYTEVMNFCCCTLWALQHKMRWNRAVTNSPWKPQWKAECGVWATFLHLWKVPNASWRSKGAVWGFFLF